MCVYVCKSIHVNIRWNAWSKDDNKSIYERVAMAGEAECPHRMR